MKYSSCRVSGQKSKLGYRYTDIGTIKVKTETEKERIKLGIFGPAHCSLYLFCSQERERKKLIPLLFFLPSHCNTRPLFPLGNHKFVLYRCLFFNDFHQVSQSSGLENHLIAATLIFVRLRNTFPEAGSTSLAPREYFLPGHKLSPYRQTAKCKHLSDCTHRSSDTLR